MSNSLDPDQARHFVGPDLIHNVGPDLIPNCLQRLTVDNKSLLAGKKLSQHVGVGFDYCLIY